MQRDYVRVERVPDWETAEAIGVRVSRSGPAYPMAAVVRYHGDEPVSVPFVGTMRAASQRAAVEAAESGAVLRQTDTATRYALARIPCAACGSTWGNHGGKSHRYITV